MLNKQSLLTAHKKQIEFPPDLSENTDPTLFRVAVTVNKGQKVLNIESFDIRFTMYNADGDRIDLSGSLPIDFYKQYGYYLGMAETEYDPSRTDNDYISMELYLPSENEVYTTYQFNQVYVQPSADVESPGWTTRSVDYDTAIRRLDIHIMYEGYKPLPPFIGLVIDLTV